MSGALTYEQLLAENRQLRWQLEEATETIQAIRTGQVDALVVQGKSGHELYTLRTADHTYRVFIETMNEGAVTLNHTGLIVYGNSTFANLVELPLSAVIGMPFSQFIAPENQSAFDGLFADHQPESRKIELTITSHTQKTIPCLLSLTTLELDEGRSLSVIITDLTNQKETQQLLRQNNDRLEKLNTALAASNDALNLSNANLEQFAFVASHDLQEPLRKIQSFGDLLKKQYEGQLGEGVNYLERMQSAAARMSVLIRDLLTYSRISTRQEAAAPVSLSTVLQTVLTDLEVAITETGAIVETNELPTVEGDAGQLGQLLQNLISNALKFRREDIPPVVQITAHRVPAQELPPGVKPVRVADAYHRINVADNGIGFDEKYVDRIFQVFQRLHGKSQYAGTGIGLSICAKVVANHGGCITAHSQPGEGATFSVYLPE